LWPQLAPAYTGPNPDPDATHVNYPKIVKCIFVALAVAMGTKMKTVGKWEC